MRHYKLITESREWDLLTTAASARDLCTDAEAEYLEAKSDDGSDALQFCDVGWYDRTGLPFHRGMAHYQRALMAIKERRAALADHYAGCGSRAAEKAREQWFT